MARGSSESSGKLPRDGIFTLEAWAEMFGYRTPQTMRDHLADRGIPVRQIGSKVVVNAETFWKHWKEEPLQ